MHIPCRLLHTNFTSYLHITTHLPHFLTSIFHTCFSPWIHLLSRTAPPFVCLTTILHHHPLLFHLPHITTTTHRFCLSPLSYICLTSSSSAMSSVSRCLFLKHHRLYILVSRTPQHSFLPSVCLAQHPLLPPSVSLTPFLCLYVLYHNAHLLFHHASW